MDYKIYTIGNYIHIEDATTGEIFSGTKKAVEIDPNNTGRAEYKFYNVKDWSSTNSLKLEQIKKEDGSDYTLAEWKTFYTENTANFNSGGGSPQNLTTEELYCVARLPLGSTTWEFVEDANHEKSENIQSITSNTAGYNFAINHSAGFTKVGALLATVDETYALFGLKIGASVGKTQSFFTVTRDGFTIRANVSASGFGFGDDTGQIVEKSDFTHTFDTATGIFVISHPNISCIYGDAAIITPYNTTYTTKLISKTPTSVTFQFFTSAGVLVTALSTLMKIYYTRTGTFQCTNEQIGNSGANFWIRGIFKK